MTHLLNAKRLCTSLTILFSQFAGLSFASTGSTPVEQAAKVRLAPNFDIIWKNDRPHIADEFGRLHQTTIHENLQLHLQAFLAERGLPIASVVVTDVKTGEVLAMVQGRSPEKWGAQTHTALYNRFPAASIFKTVVTTAALEMTSTEPDEFFGLPGGCGSQDIAPRASWMDDKRGQIMNLRKAFGHSCNGFFAKLAVNQLGIGAITKFAKFFGWDTPLPMDVSIDASRMIAPPAAYSTTHTVGRFAAGFGHVGLSPMHGAWIASIIANRGRAMPLKVLKENDKNPPLESLNPIYSQETAERLMDVMRSTVINGTASHTFGRGRYRALAAEVGGKTGTLNGRTPQGLTNLFIGVYPMSNPRIAVSSVVVLEDHYWIKAPALAAEAIMTWKEYNEQSVQLMSH